MDLEKILSMWEEDCKIDLEDLAASSRAAPMLHSKYLNILVKAKLSLKRAEMNQKTLLKDKWLYYNGQMPDDVIESKGWNFDPLNGLKHLKGEMNYYYDSDPEIQRSEEQITYRKTVVSALTEIIDNVKWRHQTVGNIIKWKVFESGG